MATPSQSFMVKKPMNCLLVQQVKINRQSMLKNNWIGLGVGSKIPTHTDSDPDFATLLVKVESLFTFSTIRSIEKVLHLPKKSNSRFWWIFTFWGPLSPKKLFLACRLCVCLSVCGHHNSKNNWASPTKFGMWSYMIKISVDIAYEQNRPTGVASALRAQFGFWAKSALKMHCTKFFFRQKLLQITIRNFWCKEFFDRPTGVASVLMA